jgi:hypothetical protein
MDIDWILTEALKATRTEDGNYKVKEQGGQERECVISFSPAGRMLFNDQDIETEDFMAYLGLLDAVEAGQTKFEADF